MVDAEYHRNYYHANKERLNERRKITRADAKSRMRNLIWKYLAEHPCTGCGETDPIVLEFNHRDPKTKVHNISDMITHFWSLKSIMEEIEKCDVLCANCHRRLTAQQFGWYGYTEHNFWV